MKRTLMAVAMATILATGIQFVSGGSEALAAEPTKKMAEEPSALMVETLSMEARVTAIDTEKRAVTLEKDGNTQTIICGPNVINFDQIKVGDLVRTTFVESLAVYIQKAGAAAGGEGIETVFLAPKGAKPGMLVTKTSVLNTKIDAVDLKERTVRITDPDGATRSIKVATTVQNLKELKKGDDVVIRFSEAMAIVVEAPKM